MNDIQTHMADIKKNLSEVNDNWKERCECMGKIMDLTDSHRDTLLPALESIKIIFRTQLGDLRSKVYTVTCKTISHLSNVYREKFSHMAEFLFPTLLHGTIVTKKVMSSAAHECLQVIVKNSSFHTLLPRISDHMKDKSAIKRRNCCEYCSIAFEDPHNKDTIHHSKDQFTKHIKKLLTDAAPDVRIQARVLFHAYAKILPSDAQKLFDSLDSGTQKRLKKKPTSTQHSKNRSRQPFSFDRSSQPSERKSLAPRPHFKRPHSKPDTDVLIFSANSKDDSMISEPVPHKAKKPAKRRKPRINPEFLEAAKANASVDEQLDSISIVTTTAQEGQETTLPERKREGGLVVVLDSNRGTAAPAPTQNTKVIVKVETGIEKENRLSVNEVADADKKKPVLLEGFWGGIIEEVNPHLTAQEKEKFVQLVEIGDDAKLVVELADWLQACCSKKRKVLARDTLQKWKGKDDITAKLLEVVLSRVLVDRNQVMEVLEKEGNPQPTLFLLKTLVGCVTEDQLNAYTEDLYTIVKQAIMSENIYVRKLSVDVVSSIVTVRGEVEKEFLSSLPDSKQKLLRFYMEQRDSPLNQRV